MRIVAFMAHPDYAVLFFGGTTIKHTQRGDEVFVVSVSAGELGAASVHPTKSRAEVAEIKTEELRKATQIQGVKDVRILSFRDAEIANTPELRLAIVAVIRELKPDMIITHWPQDAHPDIRETGQATIDACLFAYILSIKTTHPPHTVRKAYAYGIPASSVNFEPDVFVDISDVMDTKIEAARCHQAMADEVAKLFTEGDREGWMNIFLGSNMHWGQESGVRYAEPFKELQIHGLGKSALQALPT